MDRYELRYSQPKLIFTTLLLGTLFGAGVWIFIFGVEPSDVIISRNDIFWDFVGPVGGKIVGAIAAAYGGYGMVDGLATLICGRIAGSIDDHGVEIRSAFRSFSGVWSEVYDARLVPSGKKLTLTVEAPVGNKIDLYSGDIKGGKNALSQWAAIFVGKYRAAKSTNH